VLCMGHGTASIPAAVATLPRKSRRVIPCFCEIAQVSKSVLRCFGLNACRFIGSSCAIKSVFGFMFASFICWDLRIIVSLHKTAVNYSRLSGGRLLLLHGDNFKGYGRIFRQGYAAYFRLINPLTSSHSGCPEYFRRCC